MFAMIFDAREDEAGNVAISWRRSVAAQSIGPPTHAFGSGRR